MDKLKILNLFAGIGGNRKLWTDADVTAVEIDPEIARAYQDNFPNDTVIVGDAHEYLLDHFREFDFIWSSPPCPTHSRARFWRWGQERPQYPDVKLPQEITFLKHHCETKWIVENVVPYYEEWIIHDRQIGRHVFWCNFQLGHFEPTSLGVDFFTAGYSDMKKAYGFNLDEYDIERKDRKLRNCVHPEIGEYILNRARGIIQKSNTKQMNLYDATGGTG